MSLLDLIPKAGGEPSFRRCALGWWLWLANQSVSGFQRSEVTGFYALKSMVLLSHGAAEGYDLQEVEHECWECNGGGCHRCDKGVYRRTWSRLDRYEIEGVGFHIPHRILGKCEFERLKAGARSIWNSTKQSRHGFAIWSNEAYLWLLLFIKGPRALWRDEMRGHCYCSAWLPLSWLQRATMWVFHTVPYWWFDTRRKLALWLGVRGWVRLGYRIHPNEWPPCRCYSKEGYLREMDSLHKRFHGPAGHGWAVSTSAYDDIPF